MTMFDTQHFGSHSHAAALGVAVTTVDEATTLTSAHNVVCVDTSSGAVTITLPPVADAYENGIGAQYTVVCLSASNDVTVDGDGSEEIDGSTTLTVSGAYESVVLQATDTEWIVVSQKAVA